MLLPYAQLAFRGQTPVSAEYDDIYYHTQSGSAESDYVYLRGNGLPERFLEKKRFVVGEIGFGSGLNAFLTAQRFLQSVPPDHHLTVISIEHRSWQLADLQQHHAAWDFLDAGLMRELQSAFYAQYPANHRGFHLLKLHPRVQFLLLWDEVESALNELSAQVDAWYLDGFSPSKNPECWTKAVFELLAQNSAEGASFASFSAARVVRDGLTAAGFAVEKRKGFANKREMLIGRLSQPLPRLRDWREPVTKALCGLPIAVVGAGIAGATVARVLADCGREVVVFHDPNTPEASRVPVAVPYVQPDAQSALLRDYQLHSYHHALRFYATRGKAHFTPQPLHQLPERPRDAQRQSQLFDQQLLNEAQWQRSSEALIYLGSGVIDTPSLLDDLLSHSRISKHAQRIENIDENEDFVTLDGRDFAAVVLCSAWAVEVLDKVLKTRVIQSALRPVRGQGSIFKATLPRLESSALTFIPMVGEHCYVGASFQANSADFSFREHEQSEQQQALQHKLNLDTPPVAQSAFVGIRAATTDYQPLCGVLADEGELLEKYARLRFDVNAVKPQEVAARRVFLHLGFGSKGLTQAFLNAEMVAAQMLGLPLPVPRSLLTILSPNRYWVRALSRRLI